MSNTEIRLTLEETKSYIRQFPEITGKSSWKKHWEHNKGCGITQQPWQSFKMPASKFWNFVFDREEKKILNMREAKAYINQFPEIVGPKSWFEHWKAHHPKGIAKYCWDTFQMNSNEFWEYVLDKEQKTLSEAREYILQFSSIKDELRWFRHWNRWKPKGIPKYVWEHFGVQKEAFWESIAG